MGIHFSHILGIVWISASPKIFEKSITLECLFFPILSPYYGNSLFPYFGNCMGFCFTQNIWETYYFGMFVFSHIFLLLWEFTFSIFWELYGFLLHPKYLRNPLLCNVCFFPYFSRIMGIHFSHVLGIVWISASSKIFKKPINLKYLCFPILFPYYGNRLSQCVGSCMDFCFQQKIPEILNSEMFIFSHIFSLLCEFTFLIFRELYMLMPHMKYVRNP